MLYNNIYLELLFSLSQCLSCDKFGFWNIDPDSITRAWRSPVSFLALTIMQKKGVQISSTTLNLRFMQNAKIRQEQRETEVSQVKIQNKEQWHLDTPEEWVESRNRTDGASQKRVTFASSVP